MENQKEKFEQLILIEDCKIFINKMDSSVFSMERFKEVRSNPNELKKFMALLGKVEDCLGKLGDEELKEYSLRHSNPEIRKMAAEFLRSRNKEDTWFHRLGFVPKYTEMTLFLMGWMLLLLLISSSSARKELSDMLIIGDGPPIAGLIIGAIGMVLSLYHVFSKKPINHTEKICMLFFAIFVNFVVGVSAGMYVLEKSQGIWIIFPILNIASAFLLGFLFREGVITVSSIMDSQPKRPEIIFGIVAVSAIFFMSQYILKNYWSITFSVCVFYATNLNEIFNKKMVSTLIFSEKVKN